MRFTTTLRRTVWFIANRLQKIAQCQKHKCNTSLLSNICFTIQKRLIWIGQKNMSSSAAQTTPKNSNHPLPPTRVFKPLFFVLLGVFVLILATAGWGFWQFSQTKQTETQKLTTNITELQTQKDQLVQQLQEVQAELATVVTEDQFQKNKQLQTDIKNIHDTYSAAVASYETMLKLKETAGHNQVLETLFGKTLTLLADQNYSSASAQLTTLNSQLQKYQQEAATAAAAKIAANVPTIKDAPTSGSRTQAVQSDVGTFQVDVIAADLNSTRVQVETASSGDCGNNCPVAALADFVARSGGFAGINGPYFCPAEYPSCAGKTNSFDTLMMNKAKTYFNSANNVYSTVPVAIFSGGSARFLGQSQNWGRDTGVDAVIAAQPMLVSGGNVVFGGDGDPKKGSRGNRSFIGSKDSTVYIGVVRGATVAEVAHVLKAMGLTNALNLDGGGSVALYANGRYLAGPGRQTPFGIVLVRK